MAGLVMLSAVFNLLQETISDIISDDSDGIEGRVAFPKYLDVGKMTGAYIDDAEYAGPGFVQEKPEGAPMSHATIRAGAQTRYMARTFAQQLDFTREVVSDCKYEQVIEATRLQKQAIWETADMDAALMLVRAVTAGYVGGDGLTLANAAHTLPAGGTYSNTMAVPMSPSRLAVNLALSTLKQMTSVSGFIGAIEGRKILCPTAQGFTWQGIVGSEKAPEPGQFNEINTVYRYFNGIEDIVEIPYWNTTTTNWAIKTSAKNGICWKWRERPETNTWKDNSGLILCHSIWARWSRGWSNARGIYFVNA